MPGYALEISEPEELIGDCQSCFLQMPLSQIVNESTRPEGLKKLSPPVKVAELLKHSGEVLCRQISQHASGCV